MKLIIAGGRDYTRRKSDVAFLDGIKEQVTEVVSGCYTGADAFGEKWAWRNGIPVKQFPADWDRYGKPAGPIRNQQMAKYADAVVLLPGGEGTASMYREAVIQGLRIFDRREEPA